MFNHNTNWSYQFAEGELKEVELLEDILLFCGERAGVCSSGNMHRAQQPSHGSDKLMRNLFGGIKTPTSTRPSTSAGLPTIHSESHSSTVTTSRRKPSISHPRGTRRERSTSAARSSNSPWEEEVNFFACPHKSHPPAVVQSSASRL